MRMQKITARQITIRRFWFRLFMAVTVILLLMTALLAGFIGGLFAAVARVLPDSEELADIRPPVPTRVLASDGTLLAKFYRENREIVPISRMGHMVNATLAIEDIRFYSHPGIDPRGILRAIVRNLMAGDIKEGASTVTQQLARNLYLTREQKVTRKLQEVVLALELERRYSKEEILETYLNQVYYGSNRFSTQSYGVQTASKNYFGKNVEDLTLAEAALLAGLPKNPRDYNPYRYRKAAEGRRQVVLKNMLLNDMINRRQYEEALGEPIKLAREDKPSEMADAHAPYFVRYVITTELRKIFGQDWRQLVYNYGLIVHTSLDPRMQKVAEEEVTQQVQANRGRRIDDGALIAIDPQTGCIKAMVGGTNFRSDQFNIVTQGHRQPGSAFKPFVYTTALMQGYTPKKTVYDRPERYPAGNGKFWSPKNSDGKYLGAMPLERAVWLSRNAAAANVAADVGIKNVIQTAYVMGIAYPLEEYLSTALGSSVVVPLEICSAYGTLANGGVYNAPVGVTRVTSPDGEVLYEYTPRPRRALPKEIADTMEEVMRGVIERGTAARARCPFPASGKTGTTNDYRDAWFIGFTDDLVAAVWVGNRHNQPMHRTFGGTVSAPVWKQFMLVAHPIMVAEHQLRKEELARLNGMPDLASINDESPDEDEKGEDEKKEQPADAQAGSLFTVTICSETGLRATQWCPSTTVVTYTKGQLPAPPAASCATHTRPQDVPTVDNNNSGGPDKPAGDEADQGIVISICAETGKIATDKCPVVLQRRFSRNPPTETCPLHGGT
ncbi:MAG: transglycosylase domain-containing protein [Armatimonadota bacterium]